MDKQKRYNIYNGAVYPGWWPILDRYVPKILEADPEAQLYIKEKFGYLRIGVASYKIDIQQHIDWENAAEVESATVCEYCGQPGRIRRDQNWYQTLCDRCARTRGNLPALREIWQATEQKWLEEAEE